jgi:hypothetical protein
MIAATSAPQHPIRAKMTERSTMSEIIFLVEPDPEGGYTAQALGYSIYTEADTWDELKTAVQDAVRCHFDENEQPAMVRLHIVQDEVVPV